MGGSSVCCRLICVEESPPPMSSSGAVQTRAKDLIDKISTRHRYHALDFRPQYKPQQADVMNWRRRMKRPHGECDKNRDPMCLSSNGVVDDCWGTPSNLHPARPPGRSLPHEASPLPAWGLATTRRPICFLPSGSVHSNRPSSCPQVGRGLVG